MRTTRPLPRPVPALTVIATALAALGWPGCSGCTPPYQGADRADVAFVVFESDGSTSGRTVEVLDAGRAQRISSAISDRAPERTDCGTSGTLYLQKQGRTVFDEPAAINLHPDCAHIVFAIEGERHARVLEGEGLELLRSLYAESVPAHKRVAY